MNTDNTVTEAPLFNAEQARKATIEGMRGSLSKCLEDIKGKAGNGESEMWYWTRFKMKDVLPTDLLNELIALGFNTEAKYSNANDEWYLIIKW